MDEKLNEVVEVLEEAAIEEGPRGLRVDLSTLSISKVRRKMAAAEVDGDDVMVAFWARVAERLEAMDLDRAAWLAARRTGIGGSDTVRKDHRRA